MRKKSSASEELTVMEIQNNDKYFGRLTTCCLDCKQGNSGNPDILLLSPGAYQS